MKSKFLDQDVDVVSLANKGIVIGCFVGRTLYKTILFLFQTFKVKFKVIICIYVLKYCVFIILVTLKSFVYKILIIVVQLL